MAHQVVKGTTTYNRKNDRAPFINGIRVLPETVPHKKRHVSREELCSKLAVSLTEFYEEIVTPEAHNWRDKIITAY
jgi:hypothetical protein